MRDIRFLIFERIYENCKRLMVAEPTDRITPKSVPQFSDTDSLTLPDSDRLIRYIRAGNEDITNLKQNTALPALMISQGSGEFSLERQNVSGDLRPGPDRPTTTLATEPERVLFTIRLALTELPRTELFNADGTEIILRNSRAGRAFIIRNQLDYVLDPVNFMEVSQTRPGYSEKSNVINAKIISSQNIESDEADTLIDYHFQVVFKRQIIRS